MALVEDVEVIRLDEQSLESERAQKKLWAILREGVLSHDLHLIAGYLSQKAHPGYPTHWLDMVRDSPEEYIDFSETGHIRNQNEEYDPNWLWHQEPGIPPSIRNLWRLTIPGQTKYILQWRKLARHWLTKLQTSYTRYKTGHWTPLGFETQLADAFRANILSSVVTTDHGPLWSDSSLRPKGVGVARGDLEYVSRYSDRISQVNGCSELLITRDNSISSSSCIKSNGTGVQWRLSGTGPVVHYVRSNLLGEVRKTHGDGSWHTVHEPEDCHRLFEITRSHAFSGLSADRSVLLIVGHLGPCQDSSPAPYGDPFVTTLTEFVRNAPRHGKSRICVLLSEPDIRRFTTIGGGTFNKRIIQEKRQKIVNGRTRTFKVEVHDKWVGHWNRTHPETRLYHAIHLAGGLMLSCSDIWETLGVILRYLNAEYAY